MDNNLPFLIKYLSICHTDLKLILKLCELQKELNQHEFT